MKIQGKIKKAVEILEFFTMKEWNFTNENIYKLMNEMNETDNMVLHKFSIFKLIYSIDFNINFKVFNFDIRDMDWKYYIEQFCLGSKVHLLKEDLSRNENNLKRIAKYLIIHFIT